MLVWCVCREDLISLEPTGKTLSCTLACVLKVLSTIRRQVLLLRPLRWTQTHRYFLDVFDSSTAAFLQGSYKTQHLVNDCNNVAQ